MRVWELSVIDAAGQLELEMSLARSIADSMTGRSFSGTWNPPKVWSMAYRRGMKPRPIMDISAIPWAPFNLVFSARARDVLGPSIDPLGQWFDLDHEGKPLYLFNLTHTIDALDEAHATWGVHASGRPEVRGYAFRPQAVEREWLFRLSPPENFYPFLVTARFIELVEANALKGFYFKPLWDPAYPTWSRRPSGAEILERKDVFGPGGIVRGYESDWPQAWKDEEKDRKRQEREALKRGRVHSPRQQ